MHLNLSAHGAKHVHDRQARRVEAHALQSQLGIGVECPGNEPGGGRTGTADGASRGIAAGPGVSNFIVPRANEILVRMHTDEGLEGIGIATNSRENFSRSLVFADEDQIARRLGNCHAA